MTKFYLDTSALVKRYIREPGTDVMDEVFRAAWEGRVELVFSLWNIGECLVVYDKYRARGAITPEEFELALGRLLAEVLALMDRGVLTIVPVSSRVLARAWTYVLEEHIYQADALQIATCELEGCDYLLAADRRLIEVCRQRGIKALNVEFEEDQKRIICMLHEL